MNYVFSMYVPFSEWKLSFWKRKHEFWQHYENKKKSEAGVVIAQNVTSCLTCANYNEYICCMMFFTITACQCAYIYMYMCTGILYKYIFPYRCTYMCIYIYIKVCYVNRYIHAYAPVYIGMYTWCHMQKHWEAGVWYELRGKEIMYRSIFLAL